MLPTLRLSMSQIPKATAERSSTIHTNLSQIQSRIHQASSSSSNRVTLVAVSKYKPASDIKACYDSGHRDFGENYVQELVDKAKQLPLDLRWHFIGTLQSNKIKTLAAIPNLHALHTLTSIKAASALNTALLHHRDGTQQQNHPLNVFIQVNTSGEASKSGVPPLIGEGEEEELTKLARYVVGKCDRMRLCGLMTIGDIGESRKEDTEGGNEDFEMLRRTRDVLQGVLERDRELGGEDQKRLSWGWGDGEESAGGDGGGSGRLVLSMGMSSDFEVAVRMGSEVVRVGTGIFGARSVKGSQKPEVGDAPVVV